MINIVPNTTAFRKIPYQSGVYEIDLTSFLTNNRNDVNYYVSGGGSIFFAFGSNSGNYYASGITKNFFQSTTPGLSRHYDFILTQNSYDVYIDSTSIILNAPKTTGIAERIYIQATNDTAIGSFELNVFGNKPSFYIDGGIVLTAGQNIITGIRAYNQTTTPFSILSGSIQPLDLVSGLNKLPLFINQLNSGVIQISGKLTSQDTKSTVITLNTDFADFNSVITITGTAFSGSGITFVTPPAQTILVGNQSFLNFGVNNTGTEFVTFQPQINKIPYEIAIGVPSYSGIPIANYLSGYLDTTSTFFFSDNIVFSSGSFNIIQQSQTGLNIVRVLADDTPNVAVDPFIGRDSSFNITAFGQMFKPPHDFNITGLNVNMGYDPGSTAFANGDIAFINLYQGTGITGSLIGTSSSIDCTRLTPFPTGSGIDFVFPQPKLLTSGTEYSFLISGNSTWLGSNASKFLMIENTTGFYISGFMFSLNSSGFLTQYDSTYGNLVFRIPWTIPTGAKRYYTNTLSGNRAQQYLINTGTYNKYMVDKNFTFLDSSFTSNPNDNQFFTLVLTGVTSGLNIVNIKMLGTSYSQLYSGFVN